MPNEHLLSYIYCIKKSNKSRIRYLLYMKQIITKKKTRFLRGCNRMRFYRILVAVPFTYRKYQERYRTIYCNFLGMFMFWTHFNKPMWLTFFWWSYAVCFSGNRDVFTRSARIRLCSFAILNPIANR